MSKKKEIEKEIEECELEIKSLEQKLMRSRSEERRVGKEC